MTFLLKYNFILRFFYSCKKLVKRKISVKNVLKIFPLLSTRLPVIFFPNPVFIFSVIDYPDHSFFFQLFPLLTSITTVTCVSSCASGLLLFRLLLSTFFLALFLSTGINHVPPTIFILLPCLTLAG